MTSLAAWEKSPGRLRGFGNEQLFDQGDFVPLVYDLAIVRCRLRRSANGFHEQQPLPLAAQIGLRPFNVFFHRPTMRRSAFPASVISGSKKQRDRQLRRPYVSADGCFSAFIASCSHWPARSIQSALRSGSSNIPANFRHASAFRRNSAGSSGTPTPVRLKAPIGKLGQWKPKLRQRAWN
jgi:hypothetical protein